MDLHVKYRPARLSDVVGQDAVVRSLRAVLKRKPPAHAYLFSGPAGVGKTTLARIVASRLGARVVEVDAASNSGVDAMRELVRAGAYAPMTGEAAKCFIIDECHALSKAAWQSLLKAVEEPPPHLYFCFCTTEAGRVPRTIVTRCHAYALSPVEAETITDVVERVAREERIRLPKGASAAIARAAQGSVRQALVYLSAVAGMSDLDDVKRTLRSAAAEADGDAVRLFRALASGRVTWPSALRELERIDADSGYEGLRIGLVNYVGGALAKTKSERDARRLLAVLEAFREPLDRATERADFLYRLGSLLLED